MEVPLGQGGGPRTAVPAMGGGVATADGQTRTWQFTKTKLCKFHIIGMCVKGQNCPFAHEKDELRALPDLTCTKLCKRLIQTGSCEDASCTYAHTKDELRATSTFHKTKLCRFSQIGHCALGSKCNFAHSPDEVRPLEAPLPQAASREAPPLQGASGDGLYSDQQLSEAHLLLQQQLALAQHQQATQYLAGLGAPTLMPCAASQEPPLRGPGRAPPGGAGHRGHHDLSSAPDAPQMGPRSPGGQLATGANPMVPPAPVQADDMQQQRRRGDRRGKDGKGGKGEKGGGKGKGKSKGKGKGKSREAEAAESNPGQMGGAFESTGPPARSGMAENEMAGGMGAMGGMGGMGGLTGMPGLDWIARQGASMPQMPNSQGAGLPMAEAPYGGNHAAPFSNAAVQFAANNSEDLRDSPAYITQTTSDFVVKNTFLEFGAIGGPLRPVRSAAGRLDLLGGSPGEGESLRDLAASLRRSHGSAGSLSTMDRPDRGDYGGGEAAEFMSQAASRGAMGSRYYDDASASGSGPGVASDLAGGGSAMLSDCTPQSGRGFPACEDAGTGSWDQARSLQRRSSRGHSEGTDETHRQTELDPREALLNGSFTINQKDDVWQVKNTFLNFTPQTKPIRSVRTAEGALCTLGAFGDDDDQ